MTSGNRKPTILERFGTLVIDPSDVRVVTVYDGHREGSEFSSDNECGLVILKNDVEVPTTKEAALDLMARLIQG